MVKQWKTKRKADRSKALIVKLAIMGFAIVLTVAALAAFRPEQTSESQELARPEDNPPAVVSPKETPIVKDNKPKTPASLPEASGTQLANPAVDKPTRQTPIHIDSIRDFETQVLNSKGVCLVDLFSNRCPPCRALAPTISALARRYAGKAGIFKVNLDRLPSLASRYRIRAIPTVLIMKRGKVIDRLVGLQSEGQYAARLDQLLKEE